VPADIHDALVAYTDDAPPAAFTYDQIRLAGRRSQRLRRLATTGAVAVTVVAVTAGVTFEVYTPQSAPEAVTGPAPDRGPHCRAADLPYQHLKPTTLINGANGFPMRIPTEPPEHAAARFSCFLAEAVSAVLPGAVLRQDPSAPADTGPLEAYPFRSRDVLKPFDPVPPAINASALLADDVGFGEIAFRVSPAYETVATAKANCRQLSCSVRTGPHGETVTVTNVTTGSGYRRTTVNVYRGDTITLASVSNGVPQDPGSDEGGKTVGRKDLPLTVDQLIDLAAAPQLDLFP
jgi:hypothetical protein